MRAMTLKSRVLVGLCLLVSLMLCNLGYAMNRPLPRDGELGVFQTSALPHVVIDGQTFKLAAGAQVRNQQNLIVQPASIPHGADRKILYKKDRQGQIEAIWMLTDQEYQQISSSPGLHH